MPIKILSMYSPVGLLSSQSFCDFFNKFLGIFRRFFRTLSICPDRFWRLPGQGSSPIIRGPEIVSISSWRTPRGMTRRLGREELSIEAAEYQACFVRFHIPKCSPPEYKWRTLIGCHVGSLAATTGWGRCYRSGPSRSVQRCVIKIGVPRWKVTQSHTSVALGFTELIQRCPTRTTDNLQNSIVMKRDPLFLPVLQLNSLCVSALIHTWEKSDDWPLQL